MQADKEKPWTKPIPTGEPTYSFPGKQSGQPQAWTSFSFGPGVSLKLPLPGLVDTLSVGSGVVC